jgi:ferrous iron transport protein B
MVADSSDSILAGISGVLVPLMRPLGLGDWRICVSLISGFMAKESVVSTMEILFADGLGAVMTPLSAAAMLVFSLLYTPCVATIASIRRELGGKWAFAVVIWQCAVAWVVACVVHLIGMILGGV